jgi:hypothetical protein
METRGYSSPQPSPARGEGALPVCSPYEGWRWPCEIESCLLLVLTCISEGGTGGCVPSPLAGEGQGGGCRLLRCLLDRQHDTFQIFHHIIIGKSKNAISARCKPSVAAIIVTNTLLEIMTLAINLDDELAGVRNEVRDVVTHRVLSTKSKPGESIRFQVPPQQHFRARHRSSQVFGAGSLYIVYRRVRHTPLPNPPPQGGREPCQGA